MEADRSSQSPATMPDFNSIPVEKWRAGEATIRRIVSCVRPTSNSEQKRNDVVQYIRQLIQNYVGGVEVLQYGSVPLKTYLPEGDIDLTVVSNPHWEHNLPQYVYNVLLAEMHYRNDKCMLKDIQYIDAKVKLVRCVVNDIITDISFNQMSGLYALRFLDQVDLSFQKDHLFKRSIVLIKSWCYYESHILGAGWALLSTYALETLVLFIFQMYNASLNSPLLVLYRFLEYYSKFEWNKFAISIKGPVKLSLLPDIRKVITIIDPLKANNNIGQSVGIGTFFRITLALDRGARNLGKILELPKENIPEGINNFFGNTLMMHQSRLAIRPRLRFAELSGNYDDNIMNLLTGQCNQGFPYSPLVNRQVNWAHRGSYEVGSSSGANNNGHGPSSAPGLVHIPERRLEFGSFGPGSMTRFEPEPTNVRRRGRRVLKTPLPISMDVIKLPPSSSMINLLAFWFNYESRYQK